MSNKGVEFHDKLASSWSSGYKKRSFNGRLSLFCELFKAIVNPNDKWLDAGCGSGVLSRKLVDYGATVDSIDGAKLMITHAINNSKSYLQSITYNDIDTVENLSSLSNLYDGILSSSVIEYVDDPSKMLSEFFRVTNKNGILIISAPNRFSLIRVFQNILRFFFKNIGRDYFSYLAVSKNSYSYKGFVRIVEESGYTVQTVKKFSPILNKIFIIIGAYSLLIIVAKKNKS
jgi:2-polyprenyl-3-methyl-5-hydroxy-6-metoxy-1,4-benzoquinol methylase